MADGDFEAAGPQAGPGTGGNSGFYGHGPAGGHYQPPAPYQPSHQPSQWPMPPAGGMYPPPVARRPRRRWIWITAAAAAGLVVVLLITAGVVVWGAVDDSRRRQLASFGPTGHGSLKLGMSKDAAVGTGVVSPTRAATREECSEHLRRSGPQPDAAMLTATEESVKAFERAAKAAEDADAAVGPAGDRSATLPELQAKLERLKAAGAAHDAKAAAMKEMLRLGKERLVALRANGALTFNARGELVRLYAPPGARTSAGIGVGSSDDDLQRAYGSDLSDREGVYTMRATPRRADYLYQFGVEEGRVGWMALLDNDDRCA